MPKIIRVSFDFDGTLSRESVQDYAAELIARGIEVWITTSRYSDDDYATSHFVDAQYKELTNKDLYEVSDRLGILREHIHFTGYNEKWPWLKTQDFIWHLDDDWNENRQILNKTKIKAISAFGTPNWKGKCERILKKAIEQI